MLSHRPDCRASAARPELTMPIERDPVCGMSVDPDRAKARLEHDGKSYFFCCESCATKFRAAPANFLTRDAAQAAMQPAVTTGHASARSFSSMELRLQMHSRRRGRRGGFPPESQHTSARWIPKSAKARPALVPNAAWRSSLMFRRQPATRVEYTCPMHPEIVRAEPGSCPICGMALEPRTATVDGRKKS